MADYRRCPPHIVESLQRYADHHCPVGGFLTNILSNDLLASVETADDINITLIPDIVAYIYLNLPAGCWGSRKAVEAWLAGGPR